MSVTRYTCYYRDHLGYEGQVLSKPDPDGDWVRWEDYCETVRRLTEGEPVAVPELRTEYARLVEALPRTPR